MVIEIKVGDHLRWNSEAGRVTGTSIATHSGDFGYKRHVQHASKFDSQYEIRSERTGHVAAYRCAVLELVPPKGER